MLAADGPVRVVDGDKVVGIVDDEDILRVVVAEEPRLTTLDDGVTASRTRSPGPRRSSRTSTPRPSATPVPSCSIVLAVWVVGWLIFRGPDTLAIPFNQLNWFSTWINDVRDNVQSPLQTNWFFHGVIGHISSFVNWLVNQIGNLISHPAAPRPVPEIGWLGVLAIFTWVGYAVAGLRSAILVAVSVPALRPPRILDGQRRHPDHHRDRRGRQPARRDPAGHRDGAPQGGLLGGHAGPRRHADDAVVRLPAAGLHDLRPRRHLRRSC